MHIEEGSPGPWINYETPSRKGKPHVVTLEAKCLEEELSNNKGGNENSGTSCSTLDLLSTSTELALPHRSTVMQIGTHCKWWETEAQMLRAKFFEMGTDSVA